MKIEWSCWGFVWGISLFEWKNLRHQFVSKAKFRSFPYVLFHWTYYIREETRDWIESIVTRVFEEDKVDYSSIFTLNFDVFWSSKKWLMHKEDFWYFSQSFLGWDITIREVVKRRISSYGMFSRKHLIREIKMTFCIRSIYIFRKFQSWKAWQIMRMKLKALMRFFSLCFFLHRTLVKFCLSIVFSRLMFSSNFSSDI